MTHDELADDLARHLRTEKRMVWTNMQLGPADSPRPDVYSLLKSFAHPAPMAYEVKVSRADFRSDVTSGKWQAYLRYACGVYFAAEASLGIGKAEVPEHCGLVLRSGSGVWRAAKKPVLSPVVIPQEALLKLVIDGVAREGPRIRAGEYDRTERAVRKKLGGKVAQFVADAERAQIDLDAARMTAERVVEMAKLEAERIRIDAHSAALQGVYGDMLTALSLPETARPWEVQQAIRQVHAARSADHPCRERHRRLTDAVRLALERHGFETHEE